MEREKLIALVTQSQTGDMEAMEELLQYAHTPVSYQCRKMLKNEQDAEDMTQEILVSVYEKLGTLKEPAAFSKWLHQITASRCINALNRGHRELQFAEDEEGNSILDSMEELDQQKVPDKALDNAETARMINQIVDDLPEAQRVCTMLFYFDEMTVRDIAALLTVSENTVKSRLNYARKAIKDKVQDYEKEGIKLYGLSPLPFLWFFLHRAMEDSKNPKAAKIKVDKILAQKNAVGAYGTAQNVGKYASATLVRASLFAGISGKAAGIAAAVVLLGAASVGAAALIGGGSTRYQEQAAMISMFQEPEKQKTEYLTASQEETTVQLEGTTEAEAETAISQAVPPALVPDVDTPDADEPEVTQPARPSAPTEPEEAPSEPTEPEVDISPEPSAPTEPTETQPEAAASLHEHQFVVISTASDADCCTHGRIGKVEQCAICGEEQYELNFFPHDYEVTVFPATEDAPGFTLHHCTVCGACTASYIDDYTEQLPIGSNPSDHEHSYILERLDNGHCDEDTVIRHTCSICGYFFAEVTPAAGHSYTQKRNLNVSPATCTTPTTVSYACDNPQCAGFYVTEEISPALGHDYELRVVDPTSDAVGYTELNCKRCGLSFIDHYTQWTDTGAVPHTHQFTALDIPVNCLHNYVTYVCDCGYSYQDDYLAIYGWDDYRNSAHDFEVISTPPAETGGYETIRCTICGFEEWGDNIPPQSGECSHYFKSRTVQAATCAAPGLNRNKCYYCGATENVVSEIQPSNHVAIYFSATPATCTEPSRQTGTCGCGEVTYEHIVGPALGHAPDENGICTRCSAAVDPDAAIECLHNYEIVEVVPETCSSAGHIVMKCSQCGEQSRQERPANGFTHSYVFQERVAPTCLHSGYDIVVCQYCGAESKENYVDMAQHDGVIVQEHIDPTCESSGYDILFCPECNDTAKRNYYAPLGHDYLENVIPPTETEEGYTEYVCTRCGDLYEDNFVAPIQPAAEPPKEETDSTEE